MNERIGDTRQSTGLGRIGASGIGVLSLVLLVIATSVSILSPAAPDERSAAVPPPTPTALLAIPATTPTPQAGQE